MTQRHKAVHGVVSRRSDMAGMVGTDLQDGEEDVTDEARADGDLDFERMIRLVLSCLSRVGLHRLEEVLDVLVVSCTRISIIPQWTARQLLTSFCPS